MPRPVGKLLLTLLAVGAIFLSLVAAASSDEHAAASSDLICHTDNASECYPRIFQATDEFSPVHEDQQLPPGLHVRLNVWTGEKEAKINDPSEDVPAGLEGLPVEQGVVVVEAEAAAGATPPIPHHAPAYEPLGVIREPTDGNEAGSFAEAVATLKGVGLQYEGAAAAVAEAERARFDDALGQLGELAHDLYYGSRLAEDEAATGLLLRLMTLGDRGLGTRVAQQAGSVLAAAVQNNPAALRGVEQAWDQHRTAPLRGSDSSETLGERVFALAEGNGPPPWVKARLAALNGLLKSDTVMRDFLAHDGTTELLRLLVGLDGPEHEATRARAAHVVMDNFLDARMGADVARWPQAADGTSSHGCASASASKVPPHCWHYHAERLAAANGGQPSHWSTELWRLLQERGGRDEL